jgi:hypothetical protein
MRINEIASAEEQLALWKLVSDNTWAAISQQAEAERRQREQQAAQRKLKPKTGGKRGGRKSLPSPPHITPPPPPKKPPTPTATAAAAPQAAQRMAVGMQQPQASALNPQAKPLPTTQPSTAQKQLPTNPPLPNSQQPLTPKSPLTPQQMRFQRQNGGYLQKNTAVAKRL